MQKIHDEVFKHLMKLRKQDPNLFFTMRQTNRYSRLDKGYWFLGNDDYLALSFWSGKDWKNKTPNIYFEIKIDGRCQFIFSAKDSGFKNALRKDILSVIKKRFPELADPWEGEFVFVFDLWESDYLTALDRYIKDIKPVIDEMIKDIEPSEQLAYEHIREFGLDPNDINHYEGNSPIDFIYPKSFKKQVDKIREYEKSFNNKSNVGYLAQFSIKNFESIKNVNSDIIPSECRWIFLTGENGAGKSTILRAIAAGLCRNNDKGDKILKNKLGYNIKCDIYADKGTFLTSEITEEKNIPTPSGILPKAFAAYGPFRLLTETTTDSTAIPPSDSNDKYTYSLFNTISVLKDFGSSYPLPVKAEEMEETISIMLEEAAEILNVGLIAFNKNDQLVFYPIDDDTEINSPVGVPFNKLPSGTRSYAALILDLLIRLKEQQPKVDSLSEYEGIVLIDEIDIHLHPKMQKEIVEQLKNSFPGIQFIVTSHSPIPILGAPENSVFITVRNDSTKGTKIERWDNKIPIKKLLPNALLSSPIFDFQALLSDNEVFENVRTEDNFEDAFFNYMLQKEVDKLKAKDN